MGSWNCSASPHSSSRRLAVRGRDVEEHRVGERVVGGAQPAGEHPHDHPEHLRMRVDRFADRVVTEHEELRRLECTSVGGTRTVVEQRELAEQRSLVEHGHQRLASVG